MGNFTSQSTKNTVSSFTNLVNSFSNDVINEAKINCGNSQTINISSGFGPPGIGPTAQAACHEYTKFNSSSFDINQSNTSNCSLTSENITKITVQLKNKLQESIQSWITNNINQNGGWLQTALNIAAEEGINRDELVSQLTNLVTNSVSNTCSAYAQDSQVVNLYFCGYYENFNLILNQSTASLSLATCLNKTIVQSYASNSTLIDIVNKTDQNSGQAGQGLFGPLVIIIVVIVIAGLIGSIAYYYFQSNTDTPLAPPPYIPNYSMTT
jgi:hypothetical protein